MIWGAGALSERPLLAVGVAEVIALWADTEAEMGKILSQFLNTKADVSVAMYLSVASPDSRRAMLRAAAQHALIPGSSDKRLFDVVMKKTGAVRDRRNDFAHGLWGMSDQLPDALLWSSQSSEIRRLRKAEGVLERIEIGATAPTPGLWSVWQEDVFVYRQPDLDCAVTDGRDAYNAFQLLRGVLRGDPAAAVLRRNLEAIPLMQR